MKKLFNAILIIALAALLAITLFACDKPGSEDPPPEPNKLAAKDLAGSVAEGVANLAENAAAVIQQNQYTAGATAELELNGALYSLRVNANVDAVDAGANEISAEIFKDGVKRFGIYLGGRMMYIFDGEKYRLYDMFSSAEAPQTGVDLAGLVSKLGAVAYVKDKVYDSVINGYNSVLLYITVLLLEYDGTELNGEYNLQLPLAEILHKFLPVIEGFVKDIDFSKFSDILKEYVGLSYEEITNEELEYNPAELAQLYIKAKVENEVLKSVSLSYEYSDKRFSLAVKDIVFQSGRREILPSELTAAAEGGFRISGESWLNGQKIYSDITLKIDTKSSKGIDMVFKAGSSKGANDYIYAVYSGERVVPVRIYTGETEFNDGNPNKVAGAFSARVSPKFMQIISPIDFSTIEGGVPGFKLYAAIDLGEALTFIKNVIGGANPISENSAQAVAETAQTSTVNVKDILSALLPGLGIGGDEVSVTVGMSMIKNIMKAIQGESYDPEADLGATVTNLINTLATALNVPAVMEPDKVNPNQAAYDPEYRLKYLLENLLGENVTRNLSVNDFLNAMGLKLGLGLNTEGAVGLRLSAELWTTFDDGDPETPDTVSAGRSTFEIGFCDAPTVPARDVRFTVNYRPISTGYTAEIEGGIPDIEGEQYESIFFDMGSGQEPVSTDATLIALVMRLPGMLGSYGIFG